MNFREARRRIASDLSADESMDPTMEDASLPGRRQTFQPTPATDGQDPATPGGPAPYNGVAPFGEPVATDPMLPLPQGHEPGRKPIPWTGPGPDVDVTVLHGASLFNARANAYRNKTTRMR